MPRPGSCEKPRGRHSARRDGRGAGAPRARPDASRRSFQKEAATAHERAHDGSSRAVAALHSRGRDGFGRGFAGRAGRPAGVAPRHAGRKAAAAKEGSVIAARAPGCPRGSLRSLRSLRPINLVVYRPLGAWARGPRHCMCRRGARSSAGHAACTLTTLRAGRAPALAHRHSRAASSPNGAARHNEVMSPCSPAALAPASPRPRRLPAPARVRHSACRITTAGSRPRADPTPRLGPTSARGNVSAHTSRAVSRRTKSQGEAHRGKANAH